VNIQVYKMDWRWWWDKNDEGDANFLSNESKTPFYETQMDVNASKSIWNLNISSRDWGRYLIRVCDANGAHCSGSAVYVDWPEGQGNPKDAGRLTLNTNKTQYTVGEKAILQIPSPSAGRAWVIVAEGGRVVQSILTNVKTGNNQVEIPVLADMAPGCFIDVLLMQSLEKRASDRPLRLHGVIPLNIFDPATKLEPLIKTPQKISPENPLQVAVSEKSGKAMSYTLAVVDEGLLGLTHFKTPDIWSFFNQKSAFMVKSWDLYDWVIDSKSGLFQHHLSIGGDGNGPPKGSERNSNRFPPVVKFFGPYKLNANQTQNHSIQLPEYMGQVRVMVVGADDKNASGSAETHVIVKAPLALLAEAPRAFAPNEQVQIPITLFADATIKSAQIRIQTSGPIQAQKALTFNANIANGESTILIPFTILANQGIAKITLTAQSGKNISTKTLVVPVSIRTQPITTWQDQYLLPGAIWNYSAELTGLVGAAKATLEISTLPQINLSQRLDELLGYPYGCTEQTTSQAFPQLFLSSLTNLTDVQTNKADVSIKNAIQTLRERQLSQGGFSLWPGQNHADNWASTWAGFFLTEAKAKGYFVPPQSLESWMNFELNLARADEGTLSQQSFRLFALAKGGKPEIGAMNRLIEKPLALTDRYLLAAAYQLIGNGRVALTLIQNRELIVPDYRNLDLNYGSQLRDYAIILECQRILGQLKNSQSLVQNISKSLSSSNWLSTQDVSWSLLALSRLAQNNSTSAQIQWIPENGKAQNLAIKQAMLTVPVPLNKSIAAIRGQLKNTSGRPLFVRLVSTQHPNAGEERVVSENLTLNVSYRNLKGEVINPQSLKQGSDVVVMINVFNPNNFAVPNVAIHQLFASGFELSAGLNLVADAGLTGLDFSDFRDDRATLFLTLPPQKSVQIPLLFNASWPGHFYLPGVRVEAMYDGRIQALSQGQWIDILP
jgi:uncharacterized protein YfaS (alpha-2-macroglobulin family)